MKNVAAPLAKALAKRLGCKIDLEYPVHPDRKWRYDIFIKDARLAIEIDGATHASLPRHRVDCEKRNCAQISGIRVLTYPAKTLLTKCRFPKVVEQIAEAVMLGPHVATDTHVIEG